MSQFKCKMCGGTIEFEPGATVGTCDSCGTTQTLPRVDDDVIANLHNRANTLRLKCEFDKAEEIYNKILEKNPDDAEAHWGIILCKYGIEYVEDPKTYKRIPTCHRTSFDAILADDDYKAAMANGDGAQRQLYETEAKAIDRIQKDILSIVKNEKPFDVFICYKETDSDGKRTQDSAIANDIYYQLTQEGFKVFYAAITLEDKLGQEYEPYIFAALQSAKVMLVIGSKPEYFSAVWVKNEWSRFLKLMKTDRQKLLIPCYKDMDAYELPEEFAHLQAQDMSKIGFISDLARGIKKVVKEEKESAEAATDSFITPSNLVAASVKPLIERTEVFLEDGKWEQAAQYADRVLDQEPKNGYVYLLKLLARQQVSRKEDLKDCNEPFDQDEDYMHVKRYASPELIAEIEEYNRCIKERNETEKLTQQYEAALCVMNEASDEQAFKAAADLFRKICGFRDAEVLAEECLSKAEECLSKAEECLSNETTKENDKIYFEAKKLMATGNTYDLEIALRKFYRIPGWRDADELARMCENKLGMKDQTIGKRWLIVSFCMLAAAVVACIVVGLGVF